MTGNRSRWRRLRRIFQRDPVAEIDDELSYHLEQRVHDYVARGMDPETARKAALERLGDLERARGECSSLLAAERRARERRVRLSVSWLDLKLGARMLAKYPGLSLVAVIGLAVAITIGAGSFGLIYALLDPTLPLDDGDRVVSIQNNRADRAGVPDRQSLHDFFRWRDELRAIKDLGAFRTDSRNLILGDGSAELVQIAEMTASGFSVARVAPLFGRTLIEDDERAGAPPVVVIAYDEWQRRFDGDPDIVGKPIRFGSTVHTVVGVMPERFRFPVNHRFWIPFRLNPSDYERGGGPEIWIFGRLADGFTLERAQAELTTIGQRMATAFPDTHEHRRPRITPYAYPFFDVDSPRIAWYFHIMQLTISMLLVVVSANVAVLIYARTATRTGEIAVRSALGASRRRIVSQLFVEAFVLSSLAALVGLTMAKVVLDMLGSEFLGTGHAGGLPFWVELDLSPGLIAYVAALAILAALIAGVLPALKATGRRVQAGLQQLSSRGSQLQLGRVWTALIVVQVAIAVAALPAALHIVTRTTRFWMTDPGYPAHEIVRAAVSMDATLLFPRGRLREEVLPADAAARERVSTSRFRVRATELMRRLEAELGIAGVTFASRFPGDELPIEMEIEGGEPVADTTAAPSAPQGAGGFRVRVNHVSVGFFPLFDVPVVMGRGFVDADARDGSTAVIVNRTFAERIAGSGSVLGRRVRSVRRSAEATAPDIEADPWFEIVGVIPDFPNPVWWFDDAQLKLYYPAELGDAGPVTLALRMSNDPDAGLAGRLWSIAAAVDPALQLHDLGTAAEARREERQRVRFIVLLIVAPTLSVLLLSAAGIYAMMSFTVARRRREIGIRVALGADTRRILGGVFARAAVQLATGVAAGLMLAAALDWGSGGSLMGGQYLLLLPAVAALIMAVGLLAALGPARRGLAVQPTEALREE